MYKDNCEIIDMNMSNSNVGARKNRNIRDRLFVIHDILNEATNSTNKKPIDILIYDFSKCFAKLEYVNIANDLYMVGVEKQLQSKT